MYLHTYYHALCMYIKYNAFIERLWLSDVGLKSMPPCSEVSSSNLTIVRCYSGKKMEFEHCIVTVLSPFFKYF